MKKSAVVLLFVALGSGLFFLKGFLEARSQNSASTPELVVTWEYNPKSIDLSTPVNFDFTIKDKHGQNVKGAHYSTRFKLTMLGEWILFLTITLPDGQVAKKEFVLQTN